MAIVNVPDAGRTISDQYEIGDYLGTIGIAFERWPVIEFCDQMDDAELLRAYAANVDAIKAASGYSTADVINVTPDIPGLETMLAKFRREHWHDEDEVRFIVSGRGLFHIAPPRGDVVSIEMEAGDLIRVPSGTLHWFDVCGDRRIRAIRLFTDMAAWTPHYTDSGVDHRYQPMCFDDSPFLSHAV